MDVYVLKGISVKKKHFLYDAAEYRPMFNVQ